MKKFLFILFIGFCFYSSVTTQDAEKNTNIDKINKAKSKKNIPFQGFSIHLPESSFAPAYCKWLTSDYALQFNSTSKLNEESVARVFPIITERMLSQETPYMYMWFVKKDGKLIGEFSVDQIDYNFSRAVLRYVIDDEMYGQKLGTKVMYLMLIQAFDVLHLHKVYATVAVKNIASIKIFKKFGFRKVGLLKEEYVVKNGQRIDMIYFEILRSEFNNLRTKYNEFLSK